MVTALVRNSSSAPLNTVQLAVAIPKPTTASGGISAMAIATPTTVLPRPRISA